LKIENYKTGKRIFKRKLRRSEILIAGKLKMGNHENRFAAKTQS